MEEHTQYEQSSPQPVRDADAESGLALPAERRLAGMMAMSETQWANARTLLEGSGKEFVEMALHSMQDLALAGQTSDEPDYESNLPQPGISAVHGDVTSDLLSGTRKRYEQNVNAQELDIGVLPVTLTVELGRLQLDFQAVSALFNGQVLELFTDAASAVLIANGRRIGQGKLVQCQSGLALQITHLEASPS